MGARGPAGSRLCPHVFQQPVPSISGAIDRAAGPSWQRAPSRQSLAALAGRRRSALSLLALPVGVAAFFRDPDRTPDHRQVDPDLVLAPADGKVMYAGPGQDGVAPPGAMAAGEHLLVALRRAHQPHAVRRDRARTVTYRPGKWHAAYRFESATENERSEITLSDTVDGEERRVVFRQIVGLVARRVVTRVGPVTCCAPASGSA